MIPNTAIFFKDAYEIPKKLKRCTGGPVVFFPSFIAKYSIVVLGTPIYSHFSQLPNKFVLFFSMKALNN